MALLGERSLPRSSMLCTWKAREKLPEALTNHKKLREDGQTILLLIHGFNLTF